MFNAIIKDGQVCCPACEAHNYHLTEEYKAVVINNVTIDGVLQNDVHCTEFVARCVCDEKFYFQSHITMEDHIHFAVNRSQESEIKEE